MKTIILTSLLLLSSFLELQAQKTDVKQAEDLWGNRINFSKIINSLHPTVIQPFSASNCGYCLFDGWFVEKNYFETNKRKGGANFTLALFNPQLDIYAFTKHYRGAGTPVLTYPPELHQYHQDGFPAILAFRNGRQIVKIPEGSLYPYDSSFEKLKVTIWNDTTIRFQPVSDLQFATRIIYENNSYSALCVVPDGKIDQFNQNMKFADRAKCYTVKYFSQINTEDMQKNLLFEGRFPRAAYTHITGSHSPFTLDGDSVLCLGPYRLGVDTIGIAACIPNPENPGKYLVVNIRGKEVERGLFDNSVDYTVYSCDKLTKSTRVLLHGFFNKQEGSHWSFSDSLCVSNIRRNRECVGVCTIPAKKYLKEHPVTISKPRWRSVPGGEEYTFGNGSCRFPAIAADEKGTGWLAWEQQGDILLSCVDRENPVRLAVEHDCSDSYNPILTFVSGKLWIFYLNNRDGFYRLYGCSFDGTALSEPVLFSQKLPCDVVTPAVVSSGETITLAWSCWKANLRYPFYRLIRRGIPDSIHPVEVVNSASVPGYFNAWFFSLTSDRDGSAWGAWNQHYPATLGVCAGNLPGKAFTVTRISDNIDDCENGGYPSAVTDGNNRRWVFWESVPWDVMDGNQQKIYGSQFDEAAGVWSTPVMLPMDPATLLNQTPQAAVLNDGRLCIVWSGRARDGDWALYLVAKENDRWAGPLKLTSGREPARAPKIVPTEKNGLWVVCHEGKGAQMKIKVLKIIPANMFQTN